MSIFEKLGFTQTKQEPTITVVNQPAPEEPEAPPAPLTSQAAWFTPAEGDTKPVEFDPTKFFDTDPTKLNEAIGQLNFLEGAITPELLSKLQAGGEDAVAATTALVNKASQGAFAAAMQANTKMIESALAKAAPVMQARIGESSRNERIEEAIKSSSPAFQTPAAQFMVDSLKTAFASKFPNASAEEWKSMAKEYIDDIVKVSTPQAEAKKDVMATDWSKFLN